MGIANRLPGSAGAGKTSKTSVKPGDPVRSKSGKMMVAGEDGKPTTKEFKGDKVQKIRGLDISITTSANNNDEGLKLLTAVKFPVKN